MSTQEIRVTSRGEGMREALDLTEKAGQEGNLTGKDSLRLRLLAEEMFGMIRSITGDLEAQYRIDREGRKYSLHLQTSVMQTAEIRKQLLSVSSSGKNEAASTFMGKIRDMIAVILMPDEYGMFLVPPEMMEVGCPGDVPSLISSYDWSLELYRAGLQASGSEQAKEAWDELEKSITANIADDIKVSIVDPKVELTVIKSF